MPVYIDFLIIFPYCLFAQPKCMLIFLELNDASFSIAYCVHFMFNYCIIDWHHIFYFHSQIPSLLEGVIEKLLLLEAIFTKETV